MDHHTQLPLRPGPDFVAEVVASTWLDRATAYLLIGHPGVSRAGQSTAGIERALRGLAHGLGLGSDEVSSAGRLVVNHRFTALDYGHPDVMMRVPAPGPHWQGVVGRTRRVELIVGFGALFAGMNQSAIDTYLRCTTVLTGTLTLRRN
ncbi:hypothetical protein [Streptomyces sp. NPDC020965]|uniref:hypothetical protein n=1 Tax=Streptomyces sp. NPDC020965 TaxID=3365105 RepID=UPI003788B95E